MLATRYFLGLGSVLALVGCGASLTGDTGRDAGSSCAASGASCAASGCCVESYDMCLPQGSDRLCVNAIPPPADGGPQTSDGGNCIVGESSSFPYAALIFDEAPCSYTQAEVAAGIAIPWHEEIGASYTGVHPTQGDAGRCQQPDTAGLIVTFDIVGGGQQYCLCDQGLCAPQSFTTSSAGGSYYHAIAWDGRNWSGPSDTGNPEGASFPVGTYLVTLTATGTIDAIPGAFSGGPFMMGATRTITITP